MSTFPVDIEFRGLKLDAWCEASAFRPGRYHGAWEDCYPDEGGEFDVYRLTRGSKDWSFLLKKHYDEIRDLAESAAAAWAKWQGEP